MVILCHSGAMGQIWDVLRTVRTPNCLLKSEFQNFNTARISIKISKKGKIAYFQQFRGTLTLGYASKWRTNVR